MYNYESRPGSNDAQGYDLSSLEYVPFGAAPSDQPAADPAASDTLRNDYGDGGSSATIQAPSEHGTPISEPPLSSPPRKMRNRWLLSGIVAALLLVSLASFAVVSYLNRSTPSRTLDMFCSALQRQDYQTAYDQMSSQLQAQLPENVLATALSQDRVVSCTHGNASETGSSAMTSLMLKHQSNGINNDLVKLVREQDNSWKIDDLQKA